MNCPSAVACDFPAPFQAELAPTCPSCSQPMVRARGYFHCPQCHFAICEDWDRCSRDHANEANTGTVAGPQAEGQQEGEAKEVDELGAWDRHFARFLRTNSTSWQRRQRPWEDADGQLRFDHGESRFTHLGPNGVTAKELRQARSVSVQT